MATDLTSWNSTIEDLEKKVAHYAGTRYAVVCSSGRSAIRFSLLALGIKCGDEVIIPDLSCQILPITAFCTGAKPRFCDIERKTLALSPAHLPKVLHPNTKAVIFVHPYGIPVDPSPILEITQRKGVAFIDDAAQALGATIKGKKVSSFGDVGIFTFNKFLNVNSGAAAVTNNEEIADKIKSVREKFEKKSFFASFSYRIIKFFGSKSKKLMKAIFLGDNHLYELLNVKFAKKHFQIVDGWVKGDPYLYELQRSKALTNAIVNQLMAYSGKQKHYARRKLEKLEILALKSEFEDLEKCLEQRNRIAKTYENDLKEKDFSKFIVQENSVPSYLRYPILFSDENRRSMCIKNLGQAGFMIDYYYEPLHTSPFFNFGNRGSRFSESIYMSKHLLPLPINSSLSIRDVERIISIANS